MKPTIVFPKITAQVTSVVHKFSELYKAPKNPRCHITWSRFHAEDPQILGTGTWATWFVYPWFMSQFWVFFTPNKWQVSWHYHHHHNNNNTHLYLILSISPPAVVGPSMSPSSIQDLVIPEAWIPKPTLTFCSLSI